MERGIVVIGASWGGIDAVSTVLGALPAAFALPVMLVQHRGKDAHGMIDVLQRASPLPLVEPQDKEQLQAGHVYLAPADYHLLVEGGRAVFSVDEPVTFARPAIDVLFEAAAWEFGPRAVGVVLTGSSADGAVGLRRIHERGGLAVVQDPTTAEAAVMPQAALAAVPEARVLPLPEIGPFLGGLAASLPPV